MPSLSTICYYALYVIGEVESHWNWCSVNYNDPITIGIAQWYGTRAANLLEELGTEYPSLYNSLAGTLLNSLSSHSSSDNYWNSRYLSQEEGNSIITVFSDNNAHQIQENQAIDDFENYISTLESWGMSQNYPKPLIFAMSMYHQSPKSCGEVIASCGGNATLEKIYTTCLNHNVLGNYRNRYNTVYSRLNAWDGESNPPDFGQNGDTSTGGDISGINKEASKLHYILQIGDNLILYGDSPYQNGVTFIPSSGQRWKNSFNADGTSIIGGNWGGGSSTGTQAQQQIADLYKSWVGRFYYSQAPGRLDPLNTGYGDCSSTIWAAYHQITNINCGTHTGEMINLGTKIIDGRYGDVDESILQPADLLLINWKGDASYPNPSSHVEMYVGNGEICGHGGTPYYGPTIKNLHSYISGCPIWQIRRYINV